MDKVRGFEVVSGKKDRDIKLPERSTKNSAGYDFFAPEDIEIEPVMYKAMSDFIFNMLRGIKSLKSLSNDVFKIEPTLIMTGIKAYMKDDEYLGLYNRSSNPKKMGLVLSNGVGVIDSDYYNNPDNEGEIGFTFYNLLPWKVKINKGDKLGQGIFHKFLKSDVDDVSEERSGGFGSTGI